MSLKVAQLTAYFATTDSNYVNINMRAVLGEENFKIGQKYNLVLKAQMNDVGILTAAQQSDRFIVSSNMMRFQNYETAVNKTAATFGLNQLVSYATYPMFYYDTVSCNNTPMGNSCFHTFILEAEMGFFKIQAQNQTNNTSSVVVYPNYLLIFDLYKCS
jgi:hypothetical protein